MSVFPRLPFRRLIPTTAGLVLLAGAAGAGIVAADLLSGGYPSGLLHAATGTGCHGNLALLGGVQQPRRVSAAQKVGRNDPCPCGSGKKYKACCGKNQPAEE